MQNSASLFLTMTSIECWCNLSNDLPEFLLLHEFLFFFILFNHLSHISSLAVFHDNVYFSLLLINYTIIVPDNIWMMEFTQDINFWNKLLFLFFVHSAIVKLLPNEDLSVREASDFADNPKAPLSDITYLLVVSLDHFELISNLNL